MGSKITADGDCSHEIKTLAPWKNSYDQPQFSSVAQSCPTPCDPMNCSMPGLPVKPRPHIKKQRHYLANKGPSSQRYGFFPVVMYGCESWTIKKAECQRIDAFELWCWRRLLRVLWTARRSNLSILEEINPEYSLEGVILKLKVQYFDHLMQRADSLEKP